MGFAPGVVQRFGDVKRFRTAIAGLTARLYEDSR
jgi:hypothetical protein